MLATLEVYSVEMAMQLPYLRITNLNLLRKNRELPMLVVKSQWEESMEDLIYLDVSEISITNVRPTYRTTNK